MERILQKVVDSIRRQAHSTDRTGEIPLLLDRGVAHAARRFSDEAAELSLAAVGTDGHLVYKKTADVLHSLLVLLEVRGLRFEVAARDLGLRMKVVKPTMLDRVASGPDHTVFSR